MPEAPVGALILASPSSQPPRLAGGDSRSSNHSSPLSSISSSGGRTRTRLNSIPPPSNDEREPVAGPSDLSRLSTSPASFPLLFLPQGRALRQRSRIQLEPYTLERQQYRALLAKGGAKDAVIRDKAERAAVSAQMRRENEEDGSYDVSQNFPPSSPASSGNVRMSTASPPQRHEPLSDRLQALFPNLSDDDDLPPPATTWAQPFARPDEVRPPPVSLCTSFFTPNGH